MADWNKKYWYTFRNTDNQKFTVEIWEDIPEDEPLPFPAEIRGDASPAVLVYNAESLFTPVRGSGAELTLLSTFDRMFSSLYTPDMMRYQVRIYKTVQVTPIYSVEMPVWFGYLDSENYREPFDAIDNYPVSVTANDGFNLLSRMSYIEYSLGTFTKYSGMSTAWVVLMRVIQRLNLPWENLYVGLSTTPLEGTLAAGETILHKLYVNNENYYNEDGEPETCRTVLESLLKIFGAHIIQVNGDLIITDTHHTADGSTAAFKKYAYGFETTSYLATVNLPINNGDISTLTLESSKVTMEVEPGINKQVVSYSPYSLDELIKFDAKSDFSAPGAETTKGDPGYSWKETDYADSVLWDKFNNGKFCSFVGAEEVNSDKSDTYLKITNYGLTGLQYYSQLGDATKHSFKYKLPLPYAIAAPKFYIKVDVSVYARTTDNLGETPATGVKAICLTCRLKIGGKKFTAGAFHPSSTYSKWVDETATTDLILFFRDNYDDYNNNPINDYWVALDTKVPYGYFQDGLFKTSVNKSPYLIPLSGAASGVVEFDIYGYRVYDESAEVWTEIEIPDLRIKNLSLTITDKDGTAVDLSDLEYLSKLDARYANTGPEVRTLHGTNLDGYPIQRGNLLVRLEDGTYAPINGLNKAGDTDIPEKLLLRSIKSNYGGANVKLSVDLPAIPSLGYVTYDDYLPGKSLAILSNRIDLAENVSGLTLREVHTDTATIL